MVSSTLQNKLDRLPRAVAEAVYEVGPHRLTVDMILKRSGLSRTAFYERFNNAPDALAFSWRRARQDLLNAARSSPPHERWRDDITAVINALLNQAEAEPYLAGLYLAHGHAVGNDLSSFDPGVVEVLTDVLRPGRALGADPPPRTEELVAYAILSLVAERLRDGEWEALTDLTEEFIVLATLPFEVR
jgi:AcrR family transcriptional regulator